MKTLKKIAAMRYAVCALMAFCLCLPFLGCVGQKVSSTWVDKTPPLMQVGTHKSASVVEVDGVKFYIHKTRPSSDWLLIGNVIQHNYHTKKDVAEAIRSRGGDIAIRGEMLGRPGSWVISWAVGKTPTNKTTSDDKHKTEKQKAEDLRQFLRARSAADKGFVPAFTALGIAYSIGKGVDEDQKESVKWYLKAAEKGDSLAQLFLGQQYLNGRGVEKSEIEANKWFRKAAEQGLAAGQASLGAAYEKGWGVLQDRKESVKWFRKAAEQGHAVSQAALALAYHDGSGVLEDYVAAYAWVNLASANNLEVAKKFKTVLAGKMTSTQIADAQNLSRELLHQIERKNLGKSKKANSPFNAPRIDSRTGLPVIDN